MTAALCMAVILMPHLAILWLSLVDHRAWHTELVPTAFTWANYRAIFTSAQDFAPIRNSLWMSALAAGACLLVALPAGYLIGRGRPGAAWVNLLVMIPWALPGTVTAMNLILAFNHPRLSLVGTVWLLPLAYFIRNVPLLTRISTAAVEPFDATLLEVQRCTKDGIRINTFMLDADRGLQRFVEQMTELNRGRAFFTTPQTLGDFVLVDFIEQRRALLRGRRAG